jgi:hypothetical protein
LSRLPPKNPEGHKIGVSIIKRVLLTPNLCALSTGYLRAYTNA